MYFQLTAAVPIIVLLLPPSVGDIGGLNMPPRKHPLLTREQIQGTYFEQGMSMPRMAQHFEVPYSLVRDSFKAHGLSWRTKSEARAGRPWDDATKAKIAAAHTGLKDAPEVAARKREILASSWGWNKGLTAATDPRIARNAAAVRATCQTPEFRARASKSKVAQIEAGNYWNRGYVETKKEGRLYFMSSWEKRRWLELDTDPRVVNFTRHPCRVSYQWNGNQHLYLPDVLIKYDDGSKVLEEIKPLMLLERPHKGQARLLAKVQAGKDYAASQGWGWRVFSYDVSR